MTKTALVLSGGASRGAYELGVWKAIEELGLKIDIVIGTSIGAVNGSMVAQKDFATAQKLWDSLENNQRFNIYSDEVDTLPSKLRYSLATISKFFFGEAGSDVRNLLDILEPYLNEEAIRQSSIEYGLVTINLDQKMTSEYYIEDIPQGKLLDYIYASCCVSPVFKPHVIDGHRYVDGCYHDNLPVQMAINKGADKIIAVNLEAFGIVNKKLLSSTPNLTLIRSHWDLGPTFYFAPEKIQRNIRLGYLDGMKALKFYDGQAYAFAPGSAEALWKKMIKSREILPFWNSEQGQVFFLNNRRASKALFLYLRRRLINKMDIAHLSLAWAENAGELFGLDPCVTYQLDDFNKALLAEYSQTSQLDLPELPDLPGIDEITAVLSDTGITGFGALRLQLSLFKDSVKTLLQKELPQKINKRSTVKYLVKVLRDNMRESKSANALANIAALMPAECLAALYILWLTDFNN